jgi:hypothetical protein
VRLLIPDTDTRSLASLASLNLACTLTTHAHPLRSRVFRPHPGSSDAMCYSCANACIAPYVHDATKPYKLKFNEATSSIDVHCPCKSTSLFSSTGKDVYKGEESYSWNFSVLSGTNYETGSIVAWTATAGNLCLSQKCAKGDMCITTKSVGSMGLACGDVPICKNTKPGDACKLKPNVRLTLVSLKNSTFV